MPPPARIPPGNGRPRPERAPRRSITSGVSRIRRQRTREAYAEKKEARAMPGRASLRMTFWERAGYAWSFSRTVFDTHLPKALRLFSFVPYFEAKAAESALRSALHCLAAFSISSAAAVFSSRSACETHLPSAFLPFLLLPYLVAKAAGSASRSALHCFTASE